MRLVTRADFDGLACAALLTEKGLVDEYFYVHPRDVQAGKVAVSKNDILANVPYADGCGIWFDHHSSEGERLEVQKMHFEGESRSAPSAAQVIWDYYGGVKTFGKRFLPLMDAVNKVDSADLTLDEILLAEDWILLAFIIDPRTGLTQMDDYSISNETFFLNIINYCRTKTIDEILQIPDVQERADRYNEQQILFKDMLRRCCYNDRNVVITNLLEEETVYCGNRFIVFASHPDQNIEIRLEWDEHRENVSFSCGHSILNRTSRTNVGKLMFEYGGGGHDKVGSCRVPRDQWEKVFSEILEKMKQDG
ncbi:exopolyphosphatase [bacterium]|nr:exopolyphosphatase [bacterium]